MTNFKLEGAETGRYISLTLDREEAVFLLSLQAYASASLAFDIHATVIQRRRMEAAFEALTPERGNNLLRKYIRLMRVAFPDIQIQTVAACDGTTL